MWNIFKVNNKGTGPTTFNLKSKRLVGIILQRYFNGRPNLI